MTKKFRNAIKEEQISPFKKRIEKIRNELENDNIKSDSHYSAKKNIKKYFIALLTAVVDKYDYDNGYWIEYYLDLLNKILDSYDLYIEIVSDSNSNKMVDLNDKLVDLNDKLDEIRNLCDVRKNDDFELMGGVFTLLFFWALFTAAVLYFFVPVAMLTLLPSTTGLIIFSANSLPSVLTWSLSMTGACLTIYGMINGEFSLLSKINTLQKALQKALGFLGHSNDMGKEEGPEMTNINQTRLHSR